MKGEDDIKGTRGSGREEEEERLTSRGRVWKGKLYKRRKKLDKGLNLYKRKDRKIINMKCLKNI